ncbi:DUF2716 domain-containing protein [Nonomuraea terrae]|uniref:DUF2716 domain-containing protein n=2 Tax=Nonomuraea terrae TaxID=2530383 RepID=A0A4R4YJQ8_9ACTN|nr:DUF2716 domain-containing protein [Nonomuraea terrae]
MRDVLTGAGFREIATVRSYHRTPPCAPARERAVRQLIFEPEHDDLWDRFYERFRFQPSIDTYPGVTEPPASVTWHLGTGHAIAGELDRLVRRGLLACVRPDEPLYFLDWNHQGYRFDPLRVGGPGRPFWPGTAYPDGDYHLYVTADLRLGTFGHPWEESLCVFGADLLTEVEAGLTALLGPVMRRGGRNAGNIWTIGPDGVTRVRP